MREPAVRLAAAGDIPAVLRLQGENLLTNVPEGQRPGGFVTTAFTPELLQTLVDRGHAFVAMGEALQGYALCGAWDFYFQWPIFRHMASRFPGLSVEGRALDVRTSFQYGPVCIRREARGRGLLPLLFDFQRAQMASEFSVGITFINELNRRSLEAHERKLGLSIVDRFDYLGHRFATLAFPC